MKILVTGAEGFVGRHLLTSLAVAHPHADVIASARTGLHGVDVTDADAVAALIERTKPDFCFHLAGISAIPWALKDPNRAWAVNLHGTIHVGEAILAQAPGCRLVFISSAEVYGGSFRAEAALDEAAALEPMNLYAATKAAAEMALMALTSRGLRLLRLRPFNHTGAGQDETFVVPSFAGQIARIEAGLAPPVVHVGNLQPARDFLDVRDVCAAYAAIVSRINLLPNQAILNIASGVPVRIGQILDILLRMSRVEIRIEQDSARLRPVEIMKAYGNPAKAMALFDWAPKIPLDETLRSVLESARELVPSVHEQG